MMKNVNIKFFDRFILAGYTICVGRDIVENVRHCFTKVVPPFHNFRLCKNFCSKYKDLELLQKHI